MEPTKVTIKKSTSVKDSHTGAFNAKSIKKYFRDQKPHDGNGKFTDPDFPPNEHSILAQDKNGKFTDEKNGPVKSKEIDPSKLKWKRIDEIFSKSLIFEDSIECNDILQGNLGNCYFLSALSALTEMPYLLYQIFRTPEKNDQGFFEVVFFIDGEWQVVIIDDYFVTIDGTNDLKFAKSNGLELWAIILEKAWAKVNGGYANTIAGNPSDALQTITGFPVTRLFHEKMDKEKLWKELLRSDQSDNIMCTSTNDGQETIKAGLVENHAYTLIGAKEGTFDGQQLRILKIRNPWGNKEWLGRYSDNDSSWTPEKRKFFGMEEQKDDGSFCICYEDFINFYSDTNICDIMYDCNVKCFPITGEAMGQPHVFSFYLQKTSEVAISAEWRHWRFNRFALEDSHPTTIMMARYDEDDKELHEVKGEYSSNFNCQIVEDLKKGFYVVWVYCDYDATVTPKPDKYIVKFAGNSDFRVRQVGIDGGFNLVKKMFKVEINERNAKDISEAQDQYDTIDNQHDTTGIGYLYVKLTDPTKFQHWTCDASGIVAMTLLPPFKGKTQVNFGVSKDSDFIVLGMRNKQYGTYWLNIASEITTYPASAQANALKVNKDIQMSEEPNVNALLPTGTKKDKITADYYDYVSASVHLSKGELEFTKIDVTLVELEELKKQHPDYITEIMKFNPHEKVNEEGLTWSQFNYGKGSGYYIGQFKNKSIRHGRGLYVWDDDNSYYV